MKECDIFSRSKHTLTHPIYFHGVKTAKTPGSTPLVIYRSLNNHWLTQVSKMEKGWVTNATCKVSSLRRPVVSFHQLATLSLVHTRWVGTGRSSNTKFSE